MTVTGDWTMVKEERNNAERPADRDNVDRDSSAKSVSALMEGSDTPPPKRAAVRFPCLEQPPRYALRSSNGFYLGGTKKGRVVGRKKRSEQDEWTIAFVRGKEDDSNAKAAAVLEETGASASAVTIHNHKFGSVLSMVISDKSDMGRMVACVAPRGNETETESSKDNDLGLGEEAEAETNSNANGNDNDESPAEQLPDDEIEDADGDGDAKIHLPENADAEDLQWSVVRIAGDDTAAKGGVRIVSRKTGDSLGMSDAGTIVLVDSKDTASSFVWTMECVTGELCFLSNPTLDVRVRCDMPGILTLSPNWKGWEVVRITEVAAPHSGNSNANGDSDSDAGYVRISSWMHNQWFLCSDASGEVSTCSVAESLADPVIGGPGIVTGEDRCSKWAIERYPTDEESNHEGVILRSVTHGRLLSIKDGLLRTYDSREGFRFAGSASASVGAGASAGAEDIGDEKSTTTTAATNSSAADLVKHHADEMKRKSMEFKQNGSRWWKQSLTNVQKTLSDSAIHRRNSKLMAAGASPTSPSMRTVVPQEETIVWQLEAAHLQTYYFLSAPTTKEIPMTVPQNDNDTAEAEADDTLDTEPDTTPISIPARSIGAFPNVTEHLRKSDKIQFLRNDDTPDTLKLYLPDEQFYISCSSKGSIVATNKADCEGTEWVLEERAEGSVFRSHAHGLYLSLRDQDAREKAPPAAAFPPSPTNESENDTTNDNTTTDGNNDNNNAARPSPRGRFSNPFENLQEKFQKARGPVAESPTAAAGASNDDDNNTTNDNSSKASRGKPKNAFENLQEKFQKQKAPVAELCATEVFDASKCCWKLEPCTPRAISSKRLTTFAIGTSIAVGTTIAMPFALAGVAAVMGTLGAEAGIGFGIVAAGLSGAEAMASVGAIGATAYFCFKPEENSLGDGIGRDGKGGSADAKRNPWSKRPFGNWRNW